MIGTLRFMSVGISFLINIICIKALSLAEAGNLYSLISVAYFGNALFFIGFDFAIQRKIKRIFYSRQLCFSSMRSELGKILAYGSLSTLILSIIILPGPLGPVKIVLGILAACFSSLNFLLAFFRNILLLVGSKSGVTSSLVFEQSLKLLVSTFAIFFVGKNSMTIFSAFVFCSFATVALNIILVRKVINSSPAKESYNLTNQEVFHTFLPVSGSGVLNWIQLQAYRPILVRTQPDATIVGSVSFLTSLGGAVASAIFGIIAQFWMPKQFSSSGRSTHHYFYVTLASTLFLAALSYPVAFMFLGLLGKPNLYGLELLVPIGILVEGGSSMLGILGNHASLTIGSFVPSMISALVGATVAISLIYMLSANYHLDAKNLGFVLLVSQLLALCSMLQVLQLKPVQETH